MHTSEGEAGEDMVIQRTGSGIKNRWEKSFACRHKDEFWHSQTACSPLEPRALKFASCALCMLGLTMCDVGTP